MRNLIDSLFRPVLDWLANTTSYLSDLSVPVSMPVDFSKYFGYFSVLGPKWQLMITTLMALLFIYFLVYLIMSNIGLLRKFKDVIKWW